MQIPPRTCYAERAGASIAYQVFGEGPTVVMLPSAPSHLDLMWIDPGHTQVLRRLESFARTVIFDTRGVGLSDPLEHIPTVEEGADDLEAVMDAAREREPTRLRATIANMAEAGCCSPSATSAENHA